MMKGVLTVCLVALAAATLPSTAHALLPRSTQPRAPSPFAKGGTTPSSAPAAPAASAPAPSASASLGASLGRRQILREAIGFGGAAAGLALTGATTTTTAAAAAAAVFGWAEAAGASGAGPEEAARYAEKYRARPRCSPTSPEYCGGASYAAATGSTAYADEAMLARKAAREAADQSELLGLLNSPGALPEGAKLNRAPSSQRRK